MLDLGDTSQSTQQGQRKYSEPCGKGEPMPQLGHCESQVKWGCLDIQGEGGRGSGLWVLFPSTHPLSDRPRGHMGSSCRLCVLFICFWEDCARRGGREGKGRKAAGGPGEMPSGGPG